MDKTLEQKITELVTTGNLEYYQNLKAEFPPSYLNCSGTGLGASSGLYDILGIETMGNWNMPARRIT